MQYDDKAHGDKASEKGYARIGKYLEYVSRNSAILDLPGHLEQRILVDSDHSNMVKFNHRSDRTYQNILLCVHHIESFMGESQGALACQIMASRRRPHPPSIRFYAERA